MSLWSELRRRDVFKVAVAYLVAAWLIVQVVETLTAPLRLPDVLDTVVVVLLAIGFPFALIIAWVYEVTPEGIKVTGDVDDVRPARRPSGRRLTYVVIVLFVMALGLTLLGNFLRSPSSTQFGPGSRLAVLPCDDLSPDPTNAFFASGIHEELLNRLASLSGLEVISRTSVLQYEARRPPMPEIAQALNADAIIECSARYAGDRVQLTVQLIDGSSDSHIWVGAFPADMSNVESIFQIQADIAMQVANALNVEFLETERAAIERVSTHSREAYELYLAASGAPNWEAGLALLDRAIAIDDKFVDAWREKAMSHEFGVGFLSGAEASAARAAALEAADRAVLIDPDYGPAHTTRAFILAQNGNWIAAELESRRAEELGARSFVPFLQLAVGRFEDAVASLEQQLESNPMNHFAAGTLLHAYELLGDKAMRRHHWERGESLYVDGWWGQRDEPILRLLENDVEFLRTELPQALANHPVWSAGVANLSSPDAGIEAMQSLYANPEMRTAGNLRLLAAWAVYFGDSALALQWLRESVESQPTGVMTAWYPALASVRSEPGFKALIRELGLPEYWARFGWPEFCRPVGDDDFQCGVER